MKLPIVLFVAALVGSCVQIASAQKAIVYYVPFQIETYLPITMKSIEQAPFYRKNVNDAKEISELNDLMRGYKAGSAFQDGRVRLLVVMSDQRLWADAEGRIYDGTNHGALSTKNFEKLKKLLSKIVGEKQSEAPYEH